MAVRTRPRRNPSTESPTTQVPTIEIPSTERIPDMTDNASSNGKSLIQFTDTRPGFEYRAGTFFIVPDKMVEDPNLSDAEYRVLSYLHRRAGNPDPQNYSAKNRDWCRVAFTSMDTISKDTNRSKRQAQEAVTSLELKGYLKIVKRKSTNGWNNVYAIQFPASYEALNGVHYITLAVATGKKLAKKGSAENRTTLEVTAEEGGSAEFLLTPSAENRTTPSAENRTVNKTIESKTRETGTSTLRAQREGTSSLDRGNQSSPEGIPGTELSHSVRRTLASLGTKEQTSTEVIPYLDRGNASYQGVTNEEEREEEIRVQVHGSDGVSDICQQTSAPAATPQLPAKPVYVAPERKDGESDEDYKRREHMAFKSYVKRVTEYNARAELVRKQEEAMKTAGGV